MDDLISGQAAIKAVEGLPNNYNGFSDTYDKSQIIGVLEEIPSAQPELIEETAYIRGFKQGRTQGMIDSHCMGVSSETVGRRKQ